MMKEFKTKKIKLNFLILKIRDLDYKNVIFNYVLYVLTNKNTDVCPVKHLFVH